MENDQKVTEAFSRQSAVFDSLYSSKAIIAYKRERVRDHVSQFLKPRARILELNAGTGEDTVYFAKHNFLIHATDISTGMLSVLNNKIDSLHLKEKVTTEPCSFTSLNQLKNPGPYDFIFSNFAGINCTLQIDSLLKDLSCLLNPGGYVTLVFLPSFCLWEFLLLFRGKFKTAFRRFANNGVATAHVEGIYFKCRYYHPASIIKKLETDFDLIGYEGLCTVVPPSYIENFAEKYPRLCAWLQRKEYSLKDKFPWKFIGDYTILSFKKKG